MARSGLKKVVKTVKGKKGSARRAYWVKSDPNAGKKKPGFLRRHAGKILGAAALVGGAYLAHRAGATAAVKGGVQNYRKGGSFKAGASGGVSDHYAKVRSDAAEGKGGRIGAILAGASTGSDFRSRVGGARLGVAMHNREQWRGAVHAEADRHWSNAAKHQEKARRGGVAGAYHHVRSMLSARKGRQTRARAATVE